MKFDIDLPQREHFKKNKSIPFEHLLKDSELKLLQEGLGELYQNKGTEQEYRDLWRLNDKIKKIVFSKRLVDLAFELIEKKPLRLAFDLIVFEKKKFSQTHRSPFHETFTFQEQSNINPLEGVFMIALKEAAWNGISLKPGDGVFFSSLSNPSIPETGEFLLIGYTTQYSQYLHEPRDSTGYALKSLGYVFGDKLNDKDHPILLR